MKNYYRLMLGAKSAHAAECFTGGFVGTDFGIHQDLSGRLPDDWRTFNRTWVSVYMDTHPGKSKIAAGLACGALWTVSKGMQIGDIILCPNGSGQYRVGEITGDYQYVPDEILFHRRSVRWFEKGIARSDMSEALRNSTGSAGTVARITDHSSEIEKLLDGIAPPAIVTTDPSIEDVSAFAMEKHLEDFLVKNWAQTELGRDWDIYEEEGEPAGQQFETDTGRLDILAVSKDKKKLLVVELKKGRASDAVVGQTLRYMGFVQEELAEDGQTVEGIIIALDDDQRIRRALAMVPSIKFFRYQISFRLVG